MPQPFDYSLNIPDPTQNLLNVVQAGRGINQLRTEQATATRAAEAFQQLQSDIAKLGPNPTPANLADMIVRYPHLSEQFKRGYDVLTAEQQQSRTAQGSQIYAALEAGQPEIAQRMLAEQATAYRNSGDEPYAKALDDSAELLRLNPGMAKTTVGLLLASTMGSEKFTETFTKLQTERREAGLDPSKLSKSQADARKTAIDAKFAESNAVADLQKKGWDIIKIQEDVKIAKENSRIAVINAQLNREKNELKRDEMKVKLAEFEQKREQVVRDRVADVESANSNIDNMLNTADRILATSIGTIEDATGPISARLPTLSQDVADFEALIENIEAQAFLAQIPNLRGLGSLSDAEGKKVTAALQNLNLKQSPARLLANVREVQRLMLKARTSIAQRYGAPETIPDTPAATGTAPGEIDTLVRKYSGGG